MEKIFKNKSGEKFGFGIFIVLFAISVSLFAFVSEDNNITGFATQEIQNQEIKINPANLPEFKEINSLGSLAVGNYFVDENGMVYWDEDALKIPMAKINFLVENQKNREIYIDSRGRIGYVLGNLVNQNEK